MAREEAEARRRVAQENWEKVEGYLPRLSPHIAPQWHSPSFPHGSILGISSQAMHFLPYLLIQTPAPIYSKAANIQHGRVV